MVKSLLITLYLGKLVPYNTIFNCGGYRGVICLLHLVRYVQFDSL